MRAFKSSRVPTSSGASLLWVHERQPAQQYIKTVNFKEEKFLFNEYFIKFFLSDKLLKQINKTEPTQKDLDSGHIFSIIVTHYSKVELM